MGRHIVAEDRAMLGETLNAYRPVTVVTFGSKGGYIKNKYK